MSCENDNYKLIDHKQLPGKPHFELCLYQDQASQIINNVRMCLVGIGNSVDFGGAAAELIPPQDCKRFFKLIHCEEDFHRHSTGLERLLLKEGSDSR